MTATQPPAQDVSDVDIANLAQEKLGRGVHPSTVKAILKAARELQQAQVVGCNCGALRQGDADQTRHSADCTTYATPQSSAPVVGDAGPNLLAAIHAIGRWGGPDLSVRIESALTGRGS